MKNTYQLKKKKTNCVLIFENQVIATFGNLKKLIDYVRANKLIDYEKNISYWTLIRKKNPIPFGKYSIFRVKHY
jgi:hypothetical protein